MTATDEAAKNAHYKWALEQAQKSLTRTPDETELRRIGIVPWMAAWEAALESDLVRGLVSALEFYANKDNWTISEDYEGCIIEGFITSEDIEYPTKVKDTFGGYGYGGIKARSALKAFTERNRK